MISINDFNRNISPKDLPNVTDFDSLETYMKCAKKAAEYEIEWIELKAKLDGVSPVIELLKLAVENVLKVPDILDKGSKGTSGKVNFQSNTKLTSNNNDGCLGESPIDLTPAKNAINSVENKISDIGETVTDAVSDAISPVTDAISDLASKAADSLSELLSKYSFDLPAFNAFEKFEDFIDKTGIFDLYKQVKEDYECIRKNCKHFGKIISNAKEFEEIFNDIPMNESKHPKLEVMFKDEDRKVNPSISKALTDFTSRYQSYKSEKEKLKEQAKESLTSSIGL